MSTSLLYHAFGTKGYRYVRTAYVQGQTVFTLAQEPKTCRCSACKSADVVSRGHVERVFRQTFSPVRFARELWRSAPEMMDLAVQLPALLSTGFRVSIAMCWSSSSSTSSASWSTKRPIS